jgi:DNA-binding NtrC family response regulator
MLRLSEEIFRVAPHRVPVLIQGESGTGKDLVARALHQLAHRSGQFIPINAAAIPESLADAELFGHQKGAFTGALYNRAGAFEQADRGTLFLDEVAELSPALQGRLLRVVEDGRVRPIGARQEKQVEVRIVSASWADLEERVSCGRFREDLLHRLATVVLRVPALRERRSDIPMLAKCLLARFETELGPRMLSPRFLARLVEYEWPGNVRQLSSVLYRAALRSGGALLEPQYLELSRVPARRTQSGLLNPREARELYERHDKNISAAARAARVPRSTFRGWLERSRSEQERPNGQN